MREHTVSGERIWLPDDRKVVRCSDYCADCGLVRVDGDDRGRELGFYIDALTRVQEQLRQKSKVLMLRPLAEVEVRCIVMAMRNDDLFSDPWGSYRSSQIERFFELLGRHRPTLPRYLVERWTA